MPLPLAPKENDNDGSAAPAAATGAAGMPPTADVVPKAKAALADDAGCC